MFCRNNTKNQSSHCAVAARPRSSLTWRWSALGLLSAACMTATAGVTTRVSVDSEGREGVYGSGASSISADGRYVAFGSYASNLVPGDTNGQPDVFVHDRQTGETRRVSVDSAGAQGTAGSYTPTLSADGRYVAFESISSNLVPGDTNGNSDVFVHDRQTGETRRVSVDGAGAQGNFFSYVPTLSADGRYVAFVSEASNLVPGDTNNAADVFVHDRQTGETRRVSVDSAGVQGDSTSEDPTLSADGRFVSFTSYASNLVPGGTNGNPQIYVHDRQTGTTQIASADSANTPGNSASGQATLSADGRYVAFYSDSSNLVPDNTNGATHAYVHDRQTGETRRVSVDSAGEQSNDSVRSVRISADGRFVAFSSYASNLVSGDTNNDMDVFVHDRETGETQRLSVDSAGAPGNAFSDFPTLSPDGRYVAFWSSASNLVPGDTNDLPDIFVHDRLATLLEGPHGTATCTDGLDNDNDGTVDALDGDCKLPLPPHLCNGQRVTIIGTAGNDTYTGTPGSDVISTLGGDDVINGAHGNDVICGGDGNDTLNGAMGNDRVFGGDGNDTLKGGAGNDKLFGATGNDKLDGGTGTDTCDGQTGTDTHRGGCETLLNTP